MMKMISSALKLCVWAGVEALIVEALPAVNDEFTPMAVFTPPEVNEELVFPAENEEFRPMVLFEPAEVMLTP
jgi:SpoU rRNA methylase family enzyme